MWKVTRGFLSSTNRTEFCCSLKAPGLEAKPEHTILAAARGRAKGRDLCLPPHCSGQPRGEEASQHPGLLLEAHFQQLVDDDDDIPTTPSEAAAGLWCRQSRLQGWGCSSSPGSPGLSWCPESRGRWHCLHTHTHSYPLPLGTMGNVAWCKESQ